MADPDNSPPDDLATLSRLDNEILLDQLRARYDADEIYTYIGDILVAVNPFRPLQIYTPQVQSLYRGKQRSDEKPHVFAVADSAYHQMIQAGMNQCVIVSGESGAGKTESAKYVIRHITHLSRGKGSESGDTLEHKILQINPLLEAFGNAQTNLNDNSSRFGKYTELIFEPTGGIIGARISEYLLEKSRVVDQAPGEQNFHIMYYSFANPKKDELALTDTDKFPYFSNPPKGAMGAGQSFELFAEVMTALDDIGFSTAESQTVFTVVAAVLHMSRIEFVPTSEDDPLSPAQLPADSLAAVSTVCGMLEMDPTATAQALLEATNVTRGETIVRKRDKQEGLDTCDAMAKALYGRLFSWLVDQINVLLAVEPTVAGSIQKQIGILDIYGFESFETNSFEQICINLANEYLQHFFNRHVFELELAEYGREGVGDQISIQYADNRPLLDLFLNKPLGLFALLDEECTFPKATGASLVDKFKKYFKDSTYYIPKKSEGTLFQIQHYAGLVEYDSEFFLEKNRDLLAPAVVQVLQESTFAMISELFGGGTSKSETESGRAARKTPKASMSSDNTANKRAVSLGHQYTTSLQELIDNMSQCRPHFVRCIKPNHDLRPRDFQDELVLSQLKYTGMLETTRIRRDGYAVRPTYAEFIARYRSLAFGYRDVVHPTAMNCKTVLQAAGVDLAVLGRTKVFMRHPQLDELEQKLKVYQKYATLIQRYARGWSTRKRTTPMLRKARAQKADVASLLKGFKTRSNTLAAIFKAIAKEDTDRFTERREKMIAESQESATKLRMKRMQRAKEEEAKYQSARAEILDGAADDYSRRYRELYDRLQNEQRDNSTDCAQTFNELRALVDARLAVLRSKVTEFESTLAPLHAEAESVKAAEDALITERQALLPQLASTDPTAPAFESLRTQALKMLERDAALSIDLDKVRHSTSLCDNFLRDARNAVGHVEGDLTSVLTLRLDYQAGSAEEHSAEVESLRAKLDAARITYEAEAAAQQDELDNLHRVADEARMENVRISASLEDTTSNLEGTIADLRAKLASSNEKFASEIAEHEAQTEVVAQSVRELQSKLRAEKLAAETAAEEHASEITKLRSDLRAKSSAVAAAEAEREAVMHELSSKVDAGQAAEASQLRVQLTAEEAKSSDLEFKVGQLEEELRAQNNLLQLAKSEFAAMTEDLRQTIAEKEHAAQVVLSDTQADFGGKLEAAEAALSELRLRSEGQEATIAQMQAAMATLKAAHTQEVVGHEEALSQTKTKLDETTQKLKSETAAKQAAELRAVEFESAAQASAAKLDSSARKFELTSTETHRTIAALKQALDEQASAQNDLIARHQVAIDELNNQVELESAEHELLVAEYEQKLAGANEDLDERIATLKEQASEYIEAVATADARKAELEAQVELLQEANDKHVTDSTALEFKIETLEAEIAVLRARDEAREAVEEKAAAERRERMAAIVEKETVTSGKQQRAEAIRAMGRQNPGTMVPGDSEGVDLAAYVQLILDAAPPEEVVLDRFSCRGYLEKVSKSGKQVHHRWTVLDLKSKLLVWYVDDREMQINKKGSAEILDIVSVQSDQTQLVIQTKRGQNGIILEHEDPSVIDTWTAVIGAIARTRPQFTVENGD